MGVLVGLHLGVVAAVHGHPLPRNHAGGQPEPEPEDVGDRRVQVDRPVGLGAVQIDRHRGDGEVGHGQRRKDGLPDVDIEDAVKGHGVSGLEYGCTTTIRQARAGGEYRCASGSENGELGSGDGLCRCRISED